MKNKKYVIIGVLSAIFLALGCFYIFTKQDKNTSFTILEKQWLQNNKSKVIDISILKDIPVINYNGDGILFDFMNDFERVTGLDFNPIAYQDGEEIKSDYSFQVVSQMADNDILVYSDNYALLTPSNVKYNKLSELSGMSIGVLESDLEKVQNVMENLNVNFSTYSSIDEMIQNLGLDHERDEGVLPEGYTHLDGIVLPKIKNFDNIISNELLNISYNINEIKQDYVIHLGNDSKLNEIITKYFNKWNELYYSDSFGKHFSNNYFSFSNTDDKSKAMFKSKGYSYGFVENRPYDSLIDEELYGINAAFINNFSKVADIEINPIRYSNVESLISAFNKGEIDLFFDQFSGLDYSIDNTDLISNYDEQVNILTLPSNKVSVSSVKSLVGYNVATLSNTKIATYLQNHGVTLTLYDSVSDLLSKIKNDDIVALDSEISDFYSSNELKNYKSIYTFSIDDDYFFKVVNNDSNGIFSKYFNFYLSFISNQEIANAGYSELISVSSVGSFKFVIIFIVSVLIVFLIGLLIYQKIKKNENRVVISKDNKIKYIDMLTSLKNRNYLNDNIDAWDESLVYPQGLVVVDLNNVAYINDNYGHAEGDKVIKEAANILIKTQISNTEIIRTNGNEFLIYMLGYDEKQVVSYIRKLNKDFKSLSHGFGAAIGYSIINDEIKTVDDAINEATLDMRNNKDDNR